MLSSSGVPYRASCPACKHEWELALEREDDFVLYPIDPAKESQRPGYLRQLVCPNCGQGGMLMNPIEAFVSDTADVAPDPSALLRDQAQDLRERAAEDAQS